MIEIWTDGSCNNNSKHDNFGLGGWGFVVVKDKRTIFEDLGFKKGTTSSRMELKAAIEGMKYAKRKLKGERVVIVSDSAYLVNCFKDRWYLRWIEMDWYDVKNKDYWKELLDLYFSKLVKISFRKVKGHAGIEFNERADFLAGEARNWLIEKEL